MMYMAEAVSHQ